MNEKEAVVVTKIGFDILFNYARCIALLPLEEWLEAFNRFDTVGPIVNPTLYREGLHSGKPEAIKKVVLAALELKRTLEEVRESVLSGKVKP